MDWVEPASGAVALLLVFPVWFLPCLTHVKMLYHEVHLAVYLAEDQVRRSWPRRAMALSCLCTL